MPLEGGKWQLGFWRTRSGSEVDCVLYGPDGFWALEVQNGDRVRPRDLRGDELAERAASRAEPSPA